MVLQNRAPSWTYATFVLFTGASVSILVWYYVFVLHSFRFTEPGQLVVMGREIGVSCVDPRQFTSCVRAFGENTHFDRSDVISLLTMVAVPALIGLGWFLYVGYEWVFGQYRTVILKGYPVVDDKVLRQRLQSEIQLDAASYEIANKNPSYRRLWRWIEEPRWESADPALAAEQPQPVVKVKPDSMERKAERAQRRHYRKAVRYDPYKGTIRGVTDGIHLGNMGRISRERETLGTWITAAQGGGKTQIILAMARAAQLRGDRIIMSDNKGDLTEKMPLDVEVKDGKVVVKKLLLLAPSDPRTAIWNISADVRSEIQAKEFARILIPVSEGSPDPFWSQTAQGVLIACLLGLMAKGPNWTWEQLYASTMRPIDELRVDADRYYRPAVTYLDEAAEKQAASTLSSLYAALDPLHFLASGWSDEMYAKKDVPRFSLTYFIRERTDGRTVILQRSAEFGSSSDHWLTAFFTFAAKYATGTGMPDTDENPLWLILDEFGALPAIPNFEDFVERGRSKGLRTVIANQTHAQVIRRYGETATKNLDGLFTNRIIGRTALSDDAVTYAKLFGEVVERRFIKKPMGGGGYSREPDDLPRDVVSPQDLFHQLGRRMFGLRFLILNVAEGPGLFTVPFFSRRKLRPAQLQAEWVSTPFAEELKKRAKGRVDAVSASPPAATEGTRDRERTADRVERTHKGSAGVPVGGSNVQASEQPVAPQKIISNKSAYTPDLFDIPGGFGADLSIEADVDAAKGRDDGSDDGGEYDLFSDRMMNAIPHGANVHARGPERSDRAP